MRRADRLFRIVQQLRGGRLITARRLAETMEVSERTIYRDIADLMASGVPIEGEAGVGYIMRAGFDLPPLMFTRDEIAALVVGARLVRAWGGAGMALAAQEALVKIEAVLPEAARNRAAQVQVHALNFVMPEGARHHLDRLDAAITAREVVALTYRDERGAATHRAVEPLALYFWGRTWTLVAWCRLREAFRMFRIDRLADLASSGETFRSAPGRGLADFLRQAREEHGPLE